MSLLDCLLVIQAEVATVLETQKHFEAKSELKIMLETNQIDLVEMTSEGAYQVSWEAYALITEAQAHAKLFSNLKMTHCRR